MNAIVKTFVFLNLILSVFYCAFQMVLFTTRGEWKEKVDDLQAQYQAEKTIWTTSETELNDQINSLTLSLDKVNADAVEYKADVEKLNAELDSNSSEVQSAKQELEERRTRESLLEENLQKRTQELVDLRDQLAKARESAETSRASLISFREQVVTYEKERSKLRGELEIAQAALLDQEEQLKANERTLARLEANGINISEVQGGAASIETPIHAKVLAVRDDVNVVLLSVGKDDKVREGYQFTVYNGGTYKGKVMIENVYPNMSSARIIGDLMAETEEIVEGDSASTRVY